MSAKIYVGDCLETLRSMEAESVQTCVTSPPYFGLRDYGHDDQIGLEATPDAYVERLVEVFREVRRVLRTDGTLWLNLGDSYASGGRGGGGSFMDERGDAAWKGKGGATGWKSPPPGLKHKDLIGIPWMVAFALRADGWYLRQDIIWHKPNPMPESVRDRCTKSHEHVFMIAKSARYYYDAETIKEPAVCTDARKWTDNGSDKQRGHGRRHAGFNGRYAEKIAADGPPSMRNRRDVWTVATSPFQGAHFAVFPPELIRPCVLAGAPEGGVVLDPFAGAGTTGVVCVQEGRQFIGCDINPEYVKMAERRIEEARIMGSQRPLEGLTA